MNLQNIHKGLRLSALLTAGFLTIFTVDARDDKLLAAATKE
jgi:hypothetical protein